MHGRVQDEDGNALAGALVRMCNRANGDELYFGSLGWTETDENGQFELLDDRETVPFKKAWITVCKEGYGEGYITDLWGKPDRGDVVIRRGGTIVGRVVDENNKGLPNAKSQLDV